MIRERFQKQSLGNLHNIIKASRVLLVGAGGIGCELLKNLVLSNYGEVHIIDLDTIDLSNLNRQFLFRQEHIKKPKAIVAKEVAQRFNPNVKLVAHHANIKDTQFNLEWFSQFAMVFNALDNLEARRHVNKMCLAADIPLIESGTTGYNGQVQVIKKSKTACYDCNPKTTPKSYPVCTIRSTPSQPIHAIVWAKSYLLPELFGVSEEETPELDTDSDSDNAEEIQKLKEEAEALKKIRESMSSDDFVKQVFDKVFKEDIERLANMEDMWKHRKPPSPLSYETLTSESKSIDASEMAKTDQKVWTTPEDFTVFKDSILRLSKRLQEETTVASQAGLPKPVITFDKDDDDTLDFVAAAANLRSIIFGIEAKSKFDIKQMAGNIIPAIATTNAMVAGLCVMQAYKVMRGDYGKAKMTFLDKGNMRAGNIDPPNPDCPACSVVMARLRVNEKATLDDLVNLLKKELEYGDEIALTHEQDLIFDPDMEDNLSKQLTELNVKEGSFLMVKDDDDENPRVDLQLLVETSKPDDETSDAVSLIQKEDQKLEIPRKPKKKDEKESDTDGEGLTGSTTKAEVTVNGTATAPTIAKRKRELDDADAADMGAPVKKMQAAGQSGKPNDAIVLDEDEGAIEID